jgi:hypothetical protein
MKRALQYTILLAIPALCALGVSVRASDVIPRLFAYRDFTPIDFSEAVNHFVSLGENAAVEELEKLALHRDQRGEFNNDERVGWICRVLFEGRDGRALRAPKFGVLEFLPPRDLMATNWPQFPVTKSGSTYFVLWEGYISLQGSPQFENPKTYIEYCRQNGVFRERPVAVPSKEKAREDLATLKASAAWKSIKWTYDYNGKHCVLDEAFVWKFIESQSRRLQ